MATPATPQAAAYAARKAREGRSLTPAQRLAAIGSHLNAAWCMVHSPGTTPGEVALSIRLATERTRRALSLLKAASADVGTTGRA